MTVVSHHYRTCSLCEAMCGLEIQLEDDRIVAIKEAVGHTERVEALVRLCGDQLVVLSGDDQSSVQAMRHGAQGVISVAANVVPRAFKALCRAAMKGDWQAVETQEAKMKHLFGLLMIETNPIPVKWALHEMSLCSSRVRLPLTPLSAVHHEALRHCLESLGLLSQ